MNARKNNSYEMFALKSFYSCILLLCCVAINDAVNVTPNPKFSFEQCLISKPSSIGACVGIGALNKLQSIDNDPAFDIVDGVTFARDEHQPRNLFNFMERDPTDFSGILDTMGQIVSQRTLRWDMSTIYPGLMLRVAPSVNGVLEFVMDPHQEDFELKNFKEIGTARILARQLLVPLLLGFKFKVATIIPIIFGILALLAKKALFLSKAALVVSSSLALGSLLLGKPSFLAQNHHQFSGFGQNSGHHHYSHFPHHSHHNYKADDSLGDYSELLYKGFNNVESQHQQFKGFNKADQDQRGYNTFNNNENQDEVKFNKFVIAESQDQLKFQQDQIKFQQAPLPASFERERNVGRNFAWNESEKKSVDS